MSALFQRDQRHLRRRLACLFEARRDVPFSVFARRFPPGQYIHGAAGAAPGWYPLEALWFEFGHRLPLQSAAPELFPALEFLKTCWRDYLDSRGAVH